MILPTSVRPDDPLGEDTKVDIAQGRREKGAHSEPPVPDSW